MNDAVAYLSQIRVYPVKSLTGMTLSNATLTEKGSLENDRRFALVDGEGNIINANRSDLFYHLQAEYGSDLEMITVGHRQQAEQRTFALPQERAELEAWFSELFGESVSLIENRAGGFPDDPEAHGPTIISTATLQRVTEWFPGMTLDEARWRFRANLEIDGVEPFWEDHLFGPPGQPVSFRLGDVSLQGANPCARCVVPSRSPVGGERTPEFQKKFAELRRQHLSDWAEKSQFDHYYRLAVNTALEEDTSAYELQQGDVLTLE